MRSCIGLFALCSSLSALSASTLEWNNGEQVSGTLLEASPGFLTWQIEPKERPFMEPVELDLSMLRRYEPKADPDADWAAEKATREFFSLRLRDGSRLFGRVIALDAQHLTFSAERFGSVKIARESVVSLQRMNGPGVLHAGPGARDGWKADDDGKKHLWQHAPGGYLLQRGWNRAVHRDVAFPDRVEVRLTLRSQARPEFRLQLATSDGAKCVVDTWDDELVLLGEDFAPLGTLSEDQRRVSLVLFWDRKAATCSVLTRSGEKQLNVKLPMPEAKDAPPAVPETAAPPPIQGGGIAGAVLNLLQAKVQRDLRAARVAVQQRSSSKTPLIPGLSLMNKGMDLVLEELLVREWDGKLPAALSDAVPRIELADGRVLPGAIVRASEKEFTLGGGSQPESTHRWDQLLAAHQAAPVPAPAATPVATTVSYPDGMWLQGRFEGVKTPQLALKASFAPEPLTLALAELRRIDFRVAANVKAVPLGDLDTLKFQNRTLHGLLEADGGPHPRWRLIGAARSVPVVPTGDVEITRAAAQLSSRRPPALIYLHSGDILPAKLRSMDEQRLDIESSLVTTRELRPDEVLAVQFTGEPLNPDGFADKGWRVVRGTAEQARIGAVSLEFEAGGSIGHSGFAQAEEISFDLDSGNGFSAIRLRLFTNGLDLTGPSLNLLFGHMGNEAVFGLETKGEQMDNQNRVLAPRSVPVKIRLGERQIEVFMNGVSMRQITLTAAMRGGSGLIFEPFSLWGNGERPVKISNFSARAGPGRLAMPAIESKAREHALQIPRFRQESPPRHVLVAANGDLLRGVIEAGTPAHFRVRSGLEHVQIPADRVSAILWPEPPAPLADQKPAPAITRPQKAAVTHHLLLSDGGRIGLNATRFDRDAVIGTEPRLGEVRIPLDQVHLLRATAPEENALLRSFREWRFTRTPEPVLPEGGGESSPVLSKDAPVFSLPLLTGGDFDLSKEKGKVIVLDFWATWCGPCVKSLPDMIAKMSSFDSAKVRFIAVNQAEPPEQIKSFLETRGWKMDVVLDAYQRVGQQYSVEGIPHTVVISPEGKVAFVKTGYSPDGAEKIAEQVRKLLK